MYLFIHLSYALYTLEDLGYRPDIDLYYNIKISLHSLNKHYIILYILTIFLCKVQLSTNHHYICNLIKGFTFDQLE